MTEDELRDLQERTHQIQQLAKYPEWQMLYDYVSAMVQAKNRSLLNGNARTLEEYRADAGWISGAMFVLQAPERIEEQMKSATQVVLEQREAA